MKKIGIITHYSVSQNYGGLLQAYALCKKLNTMGCDAEQIQYIHEDMSAEAVAARQWNAKRIFNGVKARIARIKEKEFSCNMGIRSSSIEKFRMVIPHSSEIYSKDTIKKCNSSYDIFITGSDQVWNLDWYDEAYFLKFVESKPKYAYAASIGTNSLSSENKQVFIENMSGYAGISVRERDTVDLLNPLTDTNVQCVLDPTLLLSREEWDEICPSRRIEERYLFCYFLGEDAVERKLAREYANKYGLKVATLPYLCGQKRKCDDTFGDIQLYDISPAGFIGLIKYAEGIFTDSFHACVFSNIYEKNFYVFTRAGANKMSNRIVSLTSLFGNNERFCDTVDKQNIQYLDAVRGCCMDKTIYYEELNESVSFLNKIVNS